MPLFGRKRTDAPQGMQDVLPTSYQYRLAFVGRRLDDEGAQSVTLLEMNGDYIVRSHNGHGRTLTLAEFVGEDFDNGNVGSFGGARPTSYEGILGSIGRRLDARAAANVAIIQTRSAYQIVGWEQGTAGDQLISSPFEEIIDNESAQWLAGETG